MTFFHTVVTAKFTCDSEIYHLLLLLLLLPPTCVDLVTCFQVNIENKHRRIDSSEQGINHTRADLEALRHSDTDG